LLPAPIGRFDRKGMVGGIFGSERDDFVGSFVGNEGFDFKAEPPESFTGPFVTNALITLLWGGLRVSSVNQDWWWRAHHT